MMLLETCLPERLGPHFEQIETELDGLTELREKPAGTIRITAGEHAAYAVLWPVLATKGRREQHVRVDGQLVFNNIALRVNAVLEGLGLAFLPEDAVQPYLEKGRLRRVLEDWCPPFSGYHLYYPSRRQTSPAFGLLVDALRYRRTGR